MNKIAVLDQHTIDKIAAGEVVERPASVVKELSENAIDAGASAVTVEIEGGGKKLIRITDNGCGIEANQVRTAFLSHATSKITKAEDLEGIASLGFRGEALSSIAAVSQVELITKTPASITGSRYQIHGGKEISFDETGAPDGTTFIIRNLFYNTPARSKFLKSDTAEAGEISSMLEQLALSRPDVAFKFILNGQIRLATNGSGALKDVIYSVYGREITRSLLPIDFKNELLTIQGFIGKPEISRGNRSYESLYINGRCVKSPILSSAVENGYRGFLMSHKFPFVCLHLTMTGTDLDVNVHPRKLEVRFSRSDEIYMTLSDAVSSVLKGREMIPQVSPGRESRQANQTAAGRGEVAEPFELSRNRSFKVEEVRPSVGKTISEMKKSGQYPMDMADAAKQGEKGPQQTPPVRSGDWGEKPPVDPPGAASAPEMASCGEKEALPGKAPAPFPDGKGLKEAKERAQALSSGEAEKGTQSQKGPLPFADSQKEEEGAGKGPVTGDVADTPSAQAEGARKSEEGGICPPGEEASPSKEAAREAEAFEESEKPAFPSPSRGSEEEKGKAGEQLSLFEENFISQEAKSRHRIIGQLFDTYWLVEYDGRFFIIDQHAAHEKVCYERFAAQFKKETPDSQMLDPPLIVSLSLGEMDTLKANQASFEKAGFELEFYGGKEICIRAVPANAYGFSDEEVFTGMLDMMTGTGRADAMDLFAQRLATMACRAAVKGGNRLSFEEADALITELLSLENPYHCPHGRPTIIAMTRSEIEKKFKRIV